MAGSDDLTDQRREFAMKRWIQTAAVVLTVIVLASCAAVPESQRVPVEEAADEALWHQEWMDWRQRRLDRLVDAYGWLSLVGLDFVDDGRWQVGTAANADVVMPAGPEHWGWLVVEGERARFEPSGPAVRVDGRRGVPGMLIQPARSEPVWVEAEDVRFQIIGRNGRLAVRTRWPQAESRTGFKGLDYYPFSADWRVLARFEPHPEGRTMPIGSVLGDITEEPNPGAVAFEFDGQTFRLEAIASEGDEELFFIFADRTSGRETYGAGRMLYAPLPDENGLTVLDFNRAYSPPCAFTAYSTCPLPPPENRLDVTVTAGEKNYPDESGYRQ